MNEMVVLRSFNMLGQRAQFTVESFFYSERRATGLSARFFIDLTTDVAGSEENSDVRPSQWVAKR